jgi:hypothetical protein
MTDVNKMANIMGGGSKTGEELKEALESDPTQDGEAGKKTTTGIKDWRARLADMRQKKQAVKESIIENTSGI